MSTNAPDELPTGEDLLRHARWMRRLAGALVRDPGTAEDIVQDTWLAALAHPGPGARLRPWLGRVVRNFARQHQRGRARREWREEAAHTPEGAGSPDEHAALLEMEQRLAGELARLDPSFRSVLMLRYYEDRAPAEIARRLGIPGGTVRWRLSRGLALLRERLDRSSGGDRRAWSTALIPLVRHGTPALAGVSVAVPGFLAMNALKLVGTAAAVVVLAVGLALSGVLPDALVPWSREAPLEVGFRPLVAPAGPAPEVPPLESVALGVSRTQAERVDALESHAPVPVATRVEARVLGHGRALAGASMEVHGGAEHPGDPAGQGGHPPGWSAGDGSVACTLELREERELVRVEFHAPGYATRIQEAVCTRGTTTHLGAVELAPGGAVSGFVLDESGLGLAGCRVSLGDLDEPPRRLQALRFQPPRDDVPTCRTEANGAFRLVGAPVGLVRLWAHAPGRESAFTPPLEVREGQESFGVELRLAPLSDRNRVWGVVVGPSDEPVPRAALDFRHASDSAGMTIAGDRTADGAGRFEFIVPEDTRLWITASDPAGRWSPASAAGLPTGGPEVVLRLVEPRMLEVRALEPGGAPVPRFGLEIRAADDGPVLARHPRDEHPDGATRFGVPTQPFVVRVVAPAHDLVELGPFDPRTVAGPLRAVLRPVPGLPGVVLRGGAPASGVRVVLQAEVAEDEEVEVDGFRVRIHPEVLDEERSDAQGRFLLTARRAGSYSVRAEPDAGAPAEVGPVEVGSDLGAPPLELVLGSGGAIEGRVERRGGADPEGSIVGISRGDGHARTLRVGPDGAFRFEGLVPGPWRVQLCAEELAPGRSSVSTSTGGGIAPFELGGNCTVVEGRTTWFDLDEDGETPWVFEGRLTIDGEPAHGWAAQLGPTGALQLGEGPETVLDADGRFVLRVARSGPYRLSLVNLGEDAGQFLIDEVHITGGDAPWECALETGALVVEGLSPWDGDGVPPFVLSWRGPGERRCLSTALVDADGRSRFPRVPAGPCQMLQPSEVRDPEQWPVLREVRIQARGETTLDLR